MTDWLGMAAQPKMPRAELKAQVLGRVLTARRWPRWELAAAAVLLISLAVGGLWTRHMVRTLRAVEGQREALATHLSALMDTLSLLRSPGTRVYQIPVSTNGRVGAVTIFDDSVTHRWLVSCNGLAPNEPGEAYQIWFITEAGMRSAALMPMAHDQPMVMALEMPKDAGHVMGVAMSLEPRSGSPAPTGPMVFHVHL